MKIIRFLLTLILLLIIISGMIFSSASDDKPLYLPIIMYHEVKNFGLGKDVISPYDFESDLNFLARNNYTTITMRDLITYKQHGGNLPAKPIILSFDDGYLNNYKYVIPLLKKYNMKIVFPIIVKNTDDFSRIPDGNIDYSHVTWNQLNEMIGTGLVEVQNHTYDLHKIKNGRYGCVPKKNEQASKYEQVLIKDILKAQNKIFMMTGQRPTTFAYPYGKYVEATDLILRKLGFQATLSCRYGLNRISSDMDLYHLKRICRSHSLNIEKLLVEAYKTVKSKPPSG